MAKNRIYMTTQRKDGIPFGAVRVKDIKSVADMERRRQKGKSSGKEKREH